MQTFIEIIHVIVAFFMILVVLVQGGNQGGVGAAFGGGSSSGVFGATGATTFLGKMTYGAAAVFMVTSISLTVMMGKSGDVGLQERLRSQSGAGTAPVETTPEAQPAPAAQDMGSPVAPTTDNTTPPTATDEAPASSEPAATQDVTP